MLSGIVGGNIGVQFTENFVKRSVGRVGGGVHRVITVNVGWGVVDGSGRRGLSGRDFRVV